MIVQLTGWQGGTSGLRMRPRDRDYLPSGSSSVTLELPKRDKSSIRIECTLSPSFWDGCSEIRSAEIEKWMEERGEKPWVKNNPPKYQAEIIGNRIRVIGRTSHRSQP